jgi:hypothetical protein
LATIKQRVHKFNGSNYDTIHYETEASLVIYGNSNVAAVLDALSTTYAAKTHSHFSATPTSGQVVTADGTSGSIKTTGYTIAKSVPSDAVFTAS